LDDLQYVFEELPLLATAYLALCLKMQDQVLQRGEKRGACSLLCPFWRQLAEHVDEFEDIVDHLLHKKVNENPYKLESLNVLHEELKQFH